MVGNYYLYKWYTNLRKQEASNARAYRKLRDKAEECCDLRILYSKNFTK